MPDSYNYTTFVYDPLVNEFTPFKLFNAIGEWIDSTVQNGWSYHHYTGKHSGSFDANHVDYLDINNDPLGLARQGVTGVHNVVNPGGTPEVSQSAYFRYTDGIAADSYFFMTAYENNSSYFLTNNIRTGLYQEGHFEIPQESPLNWGSLAWDADGDTWIGTPPAGNSTDYGYAYWPTGNQAAPPRLGAEGYKWLNGYAGRDALTNQLNEGATHCTNPNPLVTCHVFAGVDNGGPYIYCCIESGEQEVGVSEKFYAHFGIGKISKFGDWKGGQFACGTYWSGTQNTTPWAEYHSRMFGSWSNRYASTHSSYIFFDTDKTPYNDLTFENASTKYLFGYDYGAYAYTAYSSLDGGTGLGSYIQGDARLNTWRNEALTIPTYITLDDITTSYDFLVGAAPSIRSCWMTNIHEGDTIVNEGETWMVFPMKCRNSVHSLARSNDYGYAYRIT